MPPVPPGFARGRRVELPAAPPVVEDVVQDAVGVRVEARGDGRPAREADGGEHRLDEGGHRTAGEEEGAEVREVAGELEEKNIYLLIFVRICAISHIKTVIVTYSLQNLAF